MVDNLVCQTLDTFHLRLLCYFPSTLVCMKYACDDVLLQVDILQA